jgi:hypothetical protein
MRRIGVLMGVIDDADGQARVKALQQGLHELGWIEGRNVRIDYRWTGGSDSRSRFYEYAPLSGVAEVDRVLG